MLPATWKDRLSPQPCWLPHHVPPAPLQRRHHACRRLPSPAVHGAQPADSAAPDGWRLPGPAARDQLHAGTLPRCKAHALIALRAPRMAACPQPWTSSHCGLPQALASLSMDSLALPRIPKEISCLTSLTNLLLSVRVSVFSTCTLPPCLACTHVAATIQRSLLCRLLYCLKHSPPPAAAEHSCRTLPAALASEPACAAPVACRK